METFEDKVAVVTGAGSGIGRALAVRLASGGARLAISDVDLARVRETALACETAGATVHVVALDVADRAAVEAYADEVAARFGRVDLVVNNAGVALAASVGEQSWTDLERVVDVDLWGVVHGSQAFLGHLLASHGHLVNVSSLFGLVAMPTQSAYCTAKFAVRGYTESLIAEVASARLPITVSCVYPGGVATNIARDARVGPGQDPERVPARFDRVSHLSPDDAARVILRGVAHRRTRILVGADARVLYAVQAVLGGLMPKVVGRVTRRLLPVPGPAEAPASTDLTSAAS